MKIPALVQVLAFPLSILYQLILRLRNLLFSIGILKQTKFDIPTISVGNLAFGGTGKTPHIEYLIRLLDKQYKTAVLSRGYKRKTKSYLFATSDSTAEQIGDEPQQIKTNFPNTAVAVCEDRVLGLPMLLIDAPETQIVLLDDCYQHRYLKPGLNILLTDYSKLYCDDFLFPVGTLREYAAASNRADFIVVTKCPSELNLTEQTQIASKLNPQKHQQVFFSTLKYDAICLYNRTTIELKKKVLFFAGIANVEPVFHYLKSQFEEIEIVHFNDHHAYKKEELANLEAHFNKLGSEWQILTTEKDLSKLNTSENLGFLAQNQVCVLPIQVAFIENNNSSNFDQSILNYVGKNQ
jgi:tetraacyldisaccharide 4'-kinase